MLSNCSLFEKITCRILCLRKGTQIIFKCCSHDAIMKYCREVLKVVWFSFQLLHRWPECTGRFWNSRLSKRDVARGTGHQWRQRRGTSSYWLPKIIISLLWLVPVADILLSVWINLWISSTGQLSIANALWDFCYWFTKIDYHLVNTRFPVCDTGCMTSQRHALHYHGCVFSSAWDRFAVWTLRFTIGRLFFSFHLQ